MADRRCLVLSCSQAKRGNEGLLPAIERYNGPAFRVVRKFLREASSELHKVDIYILSAKCGLIPADHEIADYDQRMTVHRARELREMVCAAFEKQIARTEYTEIFLSLGRVYRAAFNGCEAFSHSNNLTVSRASSGKKLTELKAWLYGQPVEEADQKESVSTVPLPVDERGRTILRGVVIEMTLDEVLSTARQALEKREGNPTNYRRWYVRIDDHRVGPKWLASQLSGLPVSAFVADEARRVLRQLGIQVYRDD